MNDQKNFRGVSPIEEETAERNEMEWWKWKTERLDKILQTVSHDRQRHWFFTLFLVFLPFAL